MTQEKQKLSLAVGQHVWTTVSHYGKVQKMTEGIVTDVHSGYCEVDIMSLHGGAPWIVYYANKDLIPIN